MEKQIDIDILLNVANKAAIKAGKAILKIYSSSREEKNIALDNFPVTKADKVSNKILVDSLSKTGLPILSEEGLHIDYDERKHWNDFWLIDPLDGTKEFLKKNGEFTINIALVSHNIPIAGVIYVPCQKTLYCGTRGAGVYKITEGKTIQLNQLSHKRSINDIFEKKDLKIVVSRSHLSKETEQYLQQYKNASVICGGSSLKFILLLEKEADMYPRLATTMEWDTAAAHALLNASGRGIYKMDLKSELSYNKPDLSNPDFIAF